MLAQLEELLLLEEPRVTQTEEAEEEEEAVEASHPYRPQLR